MTEIFFSTIYLPSWEGDGVDAAWLRGEPIRLLTHARNSKSVPDRK